MGFVKDHVSITYFYKSKKKFVSDKLRQENNYFKYFSDSNEIERFAGEVRHQFELLDYQIPIAHILDKVGFKIYKENLSANISGFIGVSDS